MYGLYITNLKAILLLWAIVCVVLFQCFMCAFFRQRKFTTVFIYDSETIKDYENRLCLIDDHNWQMHFWLSECSPFRFSGVITKGLFLFKYIWQFFILNFCLPSNRTCIIAFSIVKCLYMYKSFICEYLLYLCMWMYINLCYKGLRTSVTIK